jgi:alpha-galactosidase
MSLLAGGCFGAQSFFDAQQNTWVVTNGWVRASFQLRPDGLFTAQWIADLQSGDLWTAPQDQISTPIHLQAGSEVYDGSRAYTLIDHYTQNTTPAGVRQFIVLQDVQKTALVTLILDLYDDQPVIRYRVRYRNLTGAPVAIRAVNMLPWSFADFGKRYTALRVNQWSVDSLPEDFETFQAALDVSGVPVEVNSGAHGEQCGWLAVRDSDTRGLFAGWEFDGRTKASVYHTASGGYLGFSSAILAINHPVEAAAEFTTPSAFLGLFHGDFDEAGYRTQRFVEAVLAKKPPDQNFPYVSWDSWGYGAAIDEQTLRRNADLAAALGIELFTVDLGWARAIGDWYADDRKFPGGLDALADYVHSLGMKFGLHFAFAEADPASPVIAQHPDWTSTEDSGYHGAVSLCLANQPMQDWIVKQAIRMIDEYHVDWILQDGENMVKECTNPSHTHDPADSNYANAVQGLNAVVSAIQAARPNVYWENCEDGGNMMTFNMVQSYVTSITNDASGSLASRHAVYGATYPFPPRYAERYMPDSDGISDYATHSYRFGGNWVLMNRLADLTPDQKGFLQQEIANYKNQRAAISRGKVYHIQPPALNGTDAIQSYDAVTDGALAVITRAEADGPTYIFHPKGLIPNQRYTVWFDRDPSVYSVPGAQLMDSGIRVQLPRPYSSDVVHIQHQD